MRQPISAEVQNERRGQIDLLSDRRLFRLRRLALFGAFTFKGWALAFVVFFLAAAGWQLFAWRRFDR
ncbi:MAG: hypothetical protein JWO17_2398 [Actinomycetia bacterium]|nr:hypothetical protein [Actinomycetes bacterium]